MLPAQAAGRWRVTLLMLAIAHLGARLAFAWSAAAFVGTLVMQGRPDMALLAGSGGALLAALGLGAAIEAASAHAEARVARAVLARAENVLAAAPTRSLEAQSRGVLVAGLARHPAAMARLAVGHALARTMMAVAPLLVVGAVLPFSWSAGLVLLTALPLMIMFFVVVGSVTSSRARRQEQAFGHLAAQFSDRVRALPTILAVRGLDREQAKLRVRLANYADRTIAVLQAAFLNAAVIDFFSSLSIAVLAVFLGFGHLGLVSVPGFSGLPLATSLFILMAAPEFFAPFRRYAEQYHVKAEGEAAATEIDRLLALRAGAAAPLPREVSVRIEAAASIALPAAGLIAVVGPSGAGKTTLLRRLAGLEAAAQAPVGPAPSWVSTDSYVPEGDLGGAIAFGLDEADAARIARAAKQAGLLDDPMLPAGLETPVLAGGENLSGGQRMRVALARMLLAQGDAFCDEPTAKLDAANAAVVRDALALAARTRRVVVATHDPQLIARASRVVDLATACGEEAA